MITCTTSTVTRANGGHAWEVNGPSAFREMRRWKLPWLLVGARGCGHLLGLPPDIGDGNRPERNEVYTGNEFYQERREKLPVPPEEMGQGCCHAEVENVLGRRKGTFDK
jgi:hypothetical protein